MGYRRYEPLPAPPDGFTWDTFDRIRMPSNMAKVHDRLIAWVTRSWVGLGITDLYGWLTASMALEGERSDWRMMAGMGESLIFLAGVVFGSALASVFAAIGLCRRGRGRRWSEAAFCL